MACGHATYHGTDDADVGGVATCVLGDRWTLRDTKPQRYVITAMVYLFSELERRRGPQRSRGSSHALRAGVDPSLGTSRRAVAFKATWREPFACRATRAPRSWSASRSSTTPRC